MLSVNYNPSVLKAQNNLACASNAVSTALERMSTGFKINSAKDDAAGMFVSTNLNTKIRGLKQAQANVENGIALINTASGSLSNMNSLLNRMRDLAVQGANGIYDTDSRNAMQSEADELVKELFQIEESTVFNGRKIFGSSSVALNSEAGDTDTASVLAVSTPPPKL